MISLENAQKPTDYYDAILRMGDIGILSVEFAHALAPLAGFRNIMVHEYITLDWDVVYRNLSNIDQLETFGRLIRQWLKDRER